MPDFLDQPHDPADPNPWLALYLDRSVPMPDAVKAAWLSDTSSWCRQFALPVLRPLARLVIILIQLVKMAIPSRFTSSGVLHRLLSWSLRTFVRPDANWLILRHFHLGSEILDFVARNVEGVEVRTSPLRIGNLDEIRDHAFLKHDLNLFNFVIDLNRQLRDQDREVGAPPSVDFRGITDGSFPIAPTPDGWTNFIDLSTAIDLFTPVYQLFLTENDFWRATNSLQLDETIAIYCARILEDPTIIALVNNHHPMVPMSTLRAGYRLLLHGLSSEMLHAAIVLHKRRAEAAA